MKTKITGAGDVSARKPGGGFCLVSGTSLLRAWAAYRSGDLRLMDLRVWFGCFELVARRCVAKKGIRPKYTVDEVRSLVGGAGGEHLRHSIARLERLGLVIWGETCITLPRPDLASNDLDLALMCEQVTNHRRLVPVPRRIIRLMAGGARRVVIATILGHLLRCLYYRNGRCEAEGSCKSSWIAEVFNVGLRNVKSARQHLVRIGWLEPVNRRQAYLNRFGKRMRINLDWSRNDISGESKRSPRPADFTTGSAPPYNDKKLSSRIYMNQKPEHGPTGVFKKTARAGSPTLRHVVPDDLRDPRRLDDLRRQALKAGLVNDSECDRLRFFAAAEHAKAIGTRNACGLFATLVRRKLWQFSTHDDEDSARRTLSRLACTWAPLDGVLPKGGAALTTGKRPKLPIRQRESLVEIRSMIAASLGVEGRSALASTQPKWLPGWYNGPRGNGRCEDKLV